jgi:hypothetical protein
MAAVSSSFIGKWAGARSARRFSIRTTSSACPHVLVRIYLPAPIRSYTPCRVSGERPQLTACRNWSSRKPRTRRALIAHAAVSALAMCAYIGFSTLKAQRHTDTTIQTV